MTTLRPAGLNERRCIARDINGLYGWIVTVGKYEQGQGLSQEAWEQGIVNALTRCLEHHPALSCCVKNSTGVQPSIVKLHSVDARTHLNILPGAAALDDVAVLTSLLQQAHAEPLSDYELRPQWQVWAAPIKQETTVTSSYIGFACSHVLLDGMSSTTFHSTLQMALSEKYNFDSSQAELPPALDQAVRMPISWPFLLKPLAEELLPRVLARLVGFSDDNAWHGARQRPELGSSALITTAVKVLLIQPHTVHQALQTCRAHRSKLTALLNLLLAKSLANLLAAAGQNLTTFNTSTPYDLRRLLPASIGRMANYSSAVDQTISVKVSEPGALSTEEWEAVQRETHILQARSSTLADQPVALLRYLKNFDEWVLKKASSPSSDSFSVSNLGMFKPAPNADTTISQMVFSQSADATGAPININVASADGGPLSIVLTWWPGMLGVDNQETFINDLAIELEARLEAVKD